LDFDEYQLIKAGVMSGEEILASQEALEREYKAIRRTQYEKLKKEFEHEVAAECNHIWTMRNNEMSCAKCGLVHP